MKAEMKEKMTYGVWGFIGGAAVAMIIGFDVGWLVNLQHEPNEERCGGLGESGGDLRRPIYKGTEQSRKA